MEPNISQYQKIAEEARERYGNNYGIVYRIYCRKSNVSYVGVTTDLFSSNRSKGQQKPARILSNYNALKRGLHPCPELQQAWNASDGDSITDEVLETVAIDRHLWSGKRELQERERYWQEHFAAKTETTGYEDRHYQVKAEELRQLRDIGIINNATLVYFILKLSNPWGDRPIKVQPLEMAIEWDIPESSIYEAIGKLKEADVIAVDKAEILIRWSHSQQAPCFWESRNDSENSETILKTQNEFRESRIVSEKPEKQQSPKLASDKGFRNDCNGSNVPIVLNTCSKETNGSPTHHPVLNEQGGTGTNAQVWEQLAAADIAPNKTIQRVLGDLQNHQGAAATAKAVENAVSALQEQQSKGTVRNPGGFITAALRRGFTANQAKKEHRERSHSSPGARSHNGPAASSPPTQTRSKPQTRPPLDINTLLASVFMAVQQGDRSFALAKLQHCWAEGWHEEVEDLCITFKRDWGFIVTAQGIRDGRS
jgi:hypothetical protein